MTEQHAATGTAARSAAPAATAWSGRDSWVLGLGLMALIGLMVGALPAWSAMRLNIVDALAGR